MGRIEENYARWCELATADPDLQAELISMKDDPSAVEDAFYRDLAFGTGGLRGVIGAGTNRMNVYTVAKASQGLANYILKNYTPDRRSIAVSYDSRIKSELFAKTASGVFAANGIRVYIYPCLMPTPCLSYAVRALSCAAGIMVTASHNPSRYNGYKVYGDDGCQITTQAAADILKEIGALDLFEDVLRSDFDASLESGLIRRIPEQIYTGFTEEVKKQSMLGPDDTVDRNVAIVYSPLNGTGLKPVTRVLKESGYRNITLVKEQELPDGHFPTCPYPNPEIYEAMELGMKYAAGQQADLLMATDPDCDRVGIAVRESDGSFRLLSGNETGILLLDYICSRRQALGKMPEDPVFVKTIVTMDMAERIAAHYGVRTINVLTGFKFIGEQIGLLEKQGKEDSYIFGFEESYGYLSGTYVRDKDAVDGAFLIAEMFSYYRTRGISLTEKLQELYDLYGYTYNTLHSFEFEGSAGFDRMQEIMKDFHEKAERGETREFGGLKVLAVQDYSKGLNNLPKSDVLKYLLEGNSSVVVRPSGTEPKLKLYLSVTAPDREAAQAMEEKLTEELGKAFR